MFVSLRKGEGMKKQKKYYLSEKTAKRLAVVAAKAGLRQSQIVEAALVRELLRDAIR